MKYQLQNKHGSLAEIVISTTEIEGSMAVSILVIDNSHANSIVMSGGERIAIELSKQWANSGKAEIKVIGSNLTNTLWSRYLDDSPVAFVCINQLREEENLFPSYVKRVIKGIAFAAKFRMEPDRNNLIYTASDFWPDSLPGLIMFLRNRKHALWIAGFYLFAPNPFKGFREKGSWRVPSMRNFVYWLSQKPIYYIIKRFADAVFVTSQPDVMAFVTLRRPKDRVMVIRGGADAPVSNVDLAETIDEGEQFDAVFVGRFHPQKGVVELIDIWRMVCESIPGAKLAIIGTGPLEKKLRQNIEANNLEEEVSVLGFLDGEPKLEIFQRSKLILHPALYDSGGMAAAEGMAWGLPGIAYDLKALKSYYPRGVAKVPIGDADEFARTIVELLRDKVSRDKLGKEARDLIREEWNWEVQANRIWISLESSGMIHKEQTIM
jgi:glycosyltransferase involved in cell wall biosynthesis